MSPYSYQPLNRDSNEIRILEIQPSWRSSSTIKCDLLNFDLDKLGTGDVPFSFYEALSYTWGDAAGKVSIKLDGHPFEVTRNLSGALRRLRSKKGYRYLWVDAICINQADFQERNSQVGKMGLIYRKAEQVLIWLGEEADGSGEAMQLLERIADVDTPDEWAWASLENPSDLPKWQAVARLFDRPYWRRVWVRQEIALAVSIVVLCGKHMGSWQRFIVSAGLLEEGIVFDNIAMGVSRYQSGIYAVIGMDYLRDKISREGAVDLEDLFFHLRVCECTDKKDYVYGALGMCAPDVGIPIDYNLDKRAVFTSAAVAMINNTNSLDLLSGCQDPDRISGLPTWVPDLEADWKAVKFRSREDSHLLDHASRDRQPVYSFITRDDGSMSLKVQGVVVDTISDICGKLHIDDPSQGALLTDTLGEWRRLAVKVLSSSDPPLSDLEMRTSFWKTLIANEDPQGKATDKTVTEALQHVTERSLDSIPPIELEHGETHFSVRLRIACAARRFFATKNGYIGLAPGEAKQGDLVVVLFGASLPFIIRQEGKHFLVVGETCQ